MQFYKKTLKNFLMATLVGWLFGARLWAEPQTFVIKPGKGNKVTFTSKAPLETIIGVTDKVSGTLIVDPFDLTAPIEASFEVVMSTLDTDNQIRNEHMRKNHLHTERFPFSRFELTALVNQPASLASGTPAAFKAKGEFTLHGVTRQIDVDISTIYDSKAETIDILARFEVLLADYAIPRPQFLVMRLDELQQVEVHLTARRKQP